MSELKYVGDQILCQSCKYSSKQNKQYPICDYIARAEHSRIFNDKKERRLPKGYCDCYEEVVKNG